MFGGDSHVHCGGIPDDLSEACERSHSGPRFRLTPQRFRAQNRSRADSTTRFPPEQNQQDGPTCREGEMQAPDRDLLQVLKFELQFLEQGKYRSPLQWRPRYIFEDSPTCRRGRSSVCDCSECLLFDFVPPEHRSAPTPCRYIPLNEWGETVDSLYRTGTHDELEEALRGWLHAAIGRLARQRSLPLRKAA